MEGRIAPSTSFENRRPPKTALTHQRALSPVAVFSTARTSPTSTSTQNLTSSHAPSPPSRSSPLRRASHPTPNPTPCIQNQLLPTPSRPHKLLTVGSKLPTPPPTPSSTPALRRTHSPTTGSAAYARAHRSSFPASTPSRPVARWLVL